ncbi:hypothetical protein [Caballeronia sp. M23-90]
MLNILRRIAALLALVNSLALAQEDCTKFVVFDEYSSSSDYASYERLKTATCQDTVKDVGSAKSQSLSLGIPTEVADDVFNIKFDGKTSDQNWDTWKQHFCQSTYYEAQTQLSEKHISKVFSDNALAAVKACEASDQNYAYFQINKPGDRFSYRFKKRDGKETLKKATLSGNLASADCPADNPFKLTSMQRLFGYDLSGVPLQADCPWNGQSGAMSLTLKNGGIVTADLPKLQRVDIPPPPPPAPPPKPIMIFWTTNNWMRGPFSITLPIGNLTCTQTGKSGGWRAGTGEAINSRVCPDLTLNKGNNSFDSRDYDSDYTDNYGVCSYIISCTQN